MAKALGALGRGLPDAPARPWLFRIAHNEAIDVLRGRRPAEALDDVTVTGPPLESTVGQRGRLVQLVSDLGHLPERQRAALVLRELSGLSHEEIGAALGLSAGGARQAIFDARLSMQTFAEGRDMACADVQRRISDGDGRALRSRAVRSHLRDCLVCEGLQEAIVARRKDLAALAPPIAPAAAAGLIAQVLGGGAGAAGTAGGAGAAGTAGTVALSGIGGKTPAGAAGGAARRGGPGGGAHPPRGAAPPPRAPPAPPPGGAAPARARGG